MSRPIAASFSLLAQLVVAGCSEPECPDDEVKIGKTCVRTSKEDAAARNDLVDGGRPTGSVAEQGEVTRDASAGPDGVGRAVPDASAPSDAGCVGVAETCDGKDNDCDGVIDNDVAKNECGGCLGIAATQSVGLPCSNGGTGNCDLPGSYQCLDGATVCNAPSATPSNEVCDGKDNDCDGQVDEGVKLSWYRDCDSDGFAVNDNGSMTACTAPNAAIGCSGWTQTMPSGDRIDCNDTNSAYRPGADFGLVGVGAGDLNCDGVVEKKPVVLATTAGTPAPPGTPVCVTNCQNCYSLTGKVPGFVRLQDTTPVDAAGNPIKLAGSSEANACATELADVAGGVYGIASGNTCDVGITMHGMYATEDFYYVQVTCR